MYVHFKYFEHLSSRVDHKRIFSPLIDIILKNQYIAPPPPPTRSWPLRCPSSGVLRDDRREGTSLLPPVACKEAAGVEVVDFCHIDVFLSMPPLLPVLAPGSSKPASRHIADS